jgi:hypothetical protein
MFLCHGLRIGPVHFWAYAFRARTARKSARWVVLGPLARYEELVRPGLAAGPCQAACLLIFTCRWFKKKLFNLSTHLSTTVIDNSFMLNYFKNHTTGLHWEIQPVTQCGGIKNLKARGKKLYRKGFHDSNI